jgi:hypothetical protein
MRGREKPLLHASLSDAARRGLIAPADIPHVVDLRARRNARAYARTHGGPPGLAAMRDFQQAAVELGFLHHRFLRGTAPENFQERGQAFVERMQVTRPRIAFPAAGYAPPDPYDHRAAGGPRR